MLPSGAFSVQVYTAQGSPLREIERERDCYLRESKGERERERERESTFAHKTHRKGCLFDGEREREKHRERAFAHKTHRKGNVVWFQWRPISAASGFRKALGIEARVVFFFFFFLTIGSC